MTARAGIAIDGTRATVVLAHGEGASTAIELIRTVHAPTLQGLLAAAKPLLRAGDPVRVAIASADTAAATLDVSAELLRRSAFTSETLRATGSPADGVSVAGHIADPDAARSGQLTTALAVTAPADVVAQIYAALRERHPVEVVTSALTAGPVEGVTLALRGASTELVLVADTHPVAARQLRAGGLDGIVSLLGNDVDRVRAALTRTSPDPIAAAEVDRWLRSIVEETTLTLAEWARAGLRTTTEVFIHGSGAISVDLPATLADAGLRARTDPVLSALPGTPGERPVGVGAYLAAVTVGDGMPYAAFVDRVELARTRARLARRSRTRTLVSVGACAAMLSAAALGPTGYATVRTWQARADLSAAQAAVDAHPKTRTAATAQQLTEVAATLAGTAGHSSSALAAIMHSQTDVTISALRVGDGDGVVTVNGAAPDLDQLTAWTAKTRALLPTGSQIRTQTLTRTGANVTFTLTLTTAPPAATSLPPTSTKGGTR